MKKKSKLKTIMIVQQLDHTFWEKWDSSLIETAKNGNIYNLIEEVVNRFEYHNCHVLEAYGILHDKDSITTEIGLETKESSTVVEKHIHIVLKFEFGDTIEALASFVNLPAQYLEKAKSGRYGYDNFLSYLIHAKDSDKHQYDPKEVVTVKGKPYMDVYNERIHSWIRGKATKEARKTDDYVDLIVSQILEGKIMKEDIFLSNDLYRIYGNHKRKINEAFETNGEKRSFKAIHEIKNNLFKKSIFFIHARSGTGKTRFSKEVIHQIQLASKRITDTKWQVCNTASTNPFDEYFGQEILFLDDIRGDSLTVSDWLKLLDPYNISPISARYHNKYGSAKVIIITSTQSPSTFFNKAKSNYSEDLGQFIRRFDYLLNINNGMYKFSESHQNNDANPARQNNSNEPSYYFKYRYKLSKVDAVCKIIETVSTNNRWDDIRTHLENK